MDRNEAMRILKMVSEGKIGPEQGVDLIEEIVGGYEANTKYGSKIKIEVFDKLRGKKEVNITIPARLAKWGFKLLGSKAHKISIDGKPLDIDIEALVEEALKTSDPVEIETDEHSIVIKTVG